MLLTIRNQNMFNHVFGRFGLVCIYFFMMVEYGLNARPTYEEHTSNLKSIPKKIIPWKLDIVNNTDNLEQYFDIDDFHVIFDDKDATNDDNSSPTVKHICLDGLTVCENVQGYPEEVVREKLKQLKESSIFMKLYFALDP